MSPLSDLLARVRKRYSERRDEIAHGLAGRRLKEVDYQTGVYSGIGEAQTILEEVLKSYDEDSQESGSGTEHG